ncbi:unnamed protein product [Anisakis simplex]|uniref:ORC3_N domain-containing protein n=1 Tax=Anisakis simplex TaxID=6269 RepID=A0A0M3K4A2_ANISI|nr:unnamed protein product [Anisakis simplex]
MDRCVFVNGKRKLLSEKYSRSSKAVNQHLLSASKVTGFRRFISAFEEELDSSIASLYENVLSEIVAFVHSHWQSSDKRRPGMRTFCKCDEHSGLATGVIRCENADGFSLNESLKKLLGKEPICISAPLPPLCTIIDSIRKNEDSKCVIIKQVECLPANFIDDFISIVCDSERDSRLVLLMTISSDASVVYSRCSRQTYSQLLIRLFECPTPATVLNTFMDSVTFNPHCALRVDGKLFDALRENFLSRNYSYELLKKMVRIAAVNHYISVEHSGSDCWESLVFIERYFAFLKHLHSACDGFPSQHRSIYELHSDLQSKSAFFTDREGLFWCAFSVFLSPSIFLTVIFSYRFSFTFIPFHFVSQFVRILSFHLKEKICVLNENSCW